MEGNTLLSLEARRAHREERLARIARRRAAEEEASSRRQRAQLLQSAERMEHESELAVATTLMPTDHEEVATPWSRGEILMLAITAVFVSLYAVIFGATLAGLTGAALVVGSSVLARHFATASLKSGGKPQTRLLVAAASAPAAAYGFLVAIGVDRWWSSIAGAFGAALVVAAALVFCFSWWSLAREAWNRKDLRQRRGALEREAVVHHARAERLRQSGEGAGPSCPAPSARPGVEQ